MRRFPSSLYEKIKQRKSADSFRYLEIHDDRMVDFYSNDYLGFAKSKAIARKSFTLLERERNQNGSTGSRLISGTHALHLEVESHLASFHNAPSGLIYNSGYDANVGLLSCILQRNDIVFFDELIHASIRDGIRMGLGKSQKFNHNDLADLEKKILKIKNSVFHIYIIVESVYSMDGDTTPLRDLKILARKYEADLIVDEAHSVGIFGKKGKGLVCELEMESDVFVRIHTFGKALGCHGAIVLASDKLRDYLINFSRSFIYTTAISLHAIATIKFSFEKLVKTKKIEKLKNLIRYFKQSVNRLSIKSFFIDSDSAIQSCIISGIDRVRETARQIQNEGFMVKPILYPTVEKGKERLRISIHAYNTEKEIDSLLTHLAKFLKG